MDSGEFRKCAKETVDYVADYLDTIRERKALPDVEPGYIRKLLPDSAPEKPEKYEDVLKDIEKIIMPGMTHWNSPHFHAFFPAGFSYPSIIADILTSGITCYSLNWLSSPACTELEMKMMDWLGKILNLPKEFLFESGGSGGGVIQCNASKGTLMAFMAARRRTLNLINGAKLERLVAYTSDQSHCSVERSALLAAVRMHLLEADENQSLRGSTLRKAIEEDRLKGEIPFIVIGTLGTTSTCAFDNIKEIGKICNKEKLWFHIDAAYAGTAFICPEFRYLLDGVEYADSYCFNPHKWMLVNFDGSALWVKNYHEITEVFAENPTYPVPEKEEEVPDYSLWQLPVGRRFRSLKFWFVFRMYGVEQIRNFIRKDVRLAKEFERLIKTDFQFELFGAANLGLVCFRLKGSDELNESFIKMVNDRRFIHITGTKVKGIVIQRFAVSSFYTTSYDVSYAFKECQKVAALVKMEKISKM